MQAKAEAALIVARAVVDPKIRLEAVAPEEIHVGTRGILSVQFQYRFREESREQETWAFSLHSEMGGVVAPEQQARHEDEPGVPDEVWGVLQQTYDLRPGTHTLKFRVQASHASASWPGHGREHRDEAVVEGEVRIVAG